MNCQYTWLQSSNWVYNLLTTQSLVRSWKMLHVPRFYPQEKEPDPPNLHWQIF